MDPNFDSFYEIFEYFFQFFKINFITKSTGLQYLKESYRYPNFLLDTDF